MERKMRRKVLLPFWNPCIPWRSHPWCLRMEVDERIYNQNLILSIDPAWILGKFPLHAPSSHPLFHKYSAWKRMAFVHNPVKYFKYPNRLTIIMYLWYGGRKPTTAEEVSRCQCLFPNPNWLVWKGLPPPKSRSNTHEWITGCWRFFH